MVKIKSLQQDFRSFWHARLTLFNDNESKLWGHMRGSLPSLHWQFQKVFKRGILLLKTCVCMWVFQKVFKWGILLLKTRVCVCGSIVSDSATPWTEAPQAPLSMEFSRQEHWSGLPFPAPGVLPNPRIKPVSLMSPTLAGRFFTASTTWEAQSCS